MPVSFFPLKKLKKKKIGCPVQSKKNFLLEISYGLWVGKSNEG